MFYIAVVEVNFNNFCCCSVTKSCPTLCDPIDCSMASFPVLQYLYLTYIYIYQCGILPLKKCQKHGENETGYLADPGVPGGTSSKEPICQCWSYKRHTCNTWVGKIPRRRAWHPTPVFLPGESHGQRSLVGYSLWGRIESDTTEATEHTRMHLMDQEIGYIWW